MMSARTIQSVRGISLALGLALCASACSTIADLDPTGLIGGSDTPPAADNQFPGDPAAAPPQASDANMGTTPDLASLPARPAQTATPGQQAQTAQSLANDGAQARYSAEQLRGGTEPSAPPPGAAAPRANSPAMQQALAAAEAAPPSADVPAPAPAPAQTAMAVPPPATPAANAVAAVPQSAPAARAVEPRRPGAEPAVPANTPVRGGGVMVASDAALGFRPSSAPPLNASITQWVAAPIVARYRQTASNAGVANAAVPAVPGAQGRDSGPATIAALGGGVPPTAVVYFMGDGASLSAAGRSQIRAAVAAFKADGGMGTVRVVGHASSRTANMSVEKHLETIFAKSQARANAVAQELIHQGVPAGRVVVEAVGDSQPVYYESMPKGEDGNRRVEIYLQG